MAQAFLAFAIYGPNASTPWIIGTPTFPRDSLVYVSASFTDPFTGNLMDPDSVLIAASSPDLSASTWLSTATSNPVQKQSTGIYYAYFDDISAPGTYWWKWEGNGAGQSSMFDQTFVVTDSIFGVATYVLVLRSLYPAGLGGDSGALGYMQLGGI